MSIYTPDGGGSGMRGMSQAMNNVEEHHHHQPPPPQNQPPSLVSFADATGVVFDAMTKFLTGEDKSLLAVSVPQWSGKLLRDTIFFDRKTR